MESGARQRLRQAGYRVTRQRVAVYEYLRSEPAHRTVQDVYGAVRPAFPHISLATVYNTLEPLVRVGLVRRIHRGSSSARYCATEHPHGHFRCVVCDDVRDTPLPKLAAAEGLADCDIISISLEYMGYCPGCRRARLGLPT